MPWDYTQNSFCFIDKVNSSPQKNGSINYRKSDNNAIKLLFLVLDLKGVLKINIS